MNTSDRTSEKAPSVGQDISADNGRWSFGGDVHRRFEEHIEQSVPHYRDGHDMIARLSDYFLYEGATALEIGCSTGALLARLASWHDTRRLRLVGIEIEAEMAHAAQKNLAGDNRVEIHEGDILDIDLEPCNMIASYYTIQFIRPARRQALFDKIYQTLEWGGAFIMFEKVRAPDARFQDIASALYNDFKLEKGLSEAEIVHKTRSLKGVLEPFSTQGNIDMMKRAGFVDIMSVYKHICFEGFLAIK
jgi:tRNA (cmo5U34)-methyltransferase